MHNLILNELNIDYSKITTGVYGYTITVDFGRNKFEKEDGKLKAFFESGRARYEVPLSAVTETFATGNVKQYMVAIPYHTGALSSVSLSWTRGRKISDLFTGKHKIYIDKVTVDPSYLHDFG